MTAAFAIVEFESMIAEINEQRNILPGFDMALEELGFASIDELKRANFTTIRRIHDHFEKIIYLT